MADHIEYLMLRLVMAGYVAFLGTKVLVRISVWSELESGSSAQQRELVFKGFALISVIPYFIVCLSVAEILFEVAKNYGWVGQDLFGIPDYKNEMQEIAGSGMVLLILFIAAICEALLFHRYKGKYAKRYLRNTTVQQ